MSLNPMCPLSQRNVYEIFTIAKVERTKSEETYFFLSFKDKIARKLARAGSLLLFSRCGVWLSADKGLWRLRLPYPSLAPRVCSNSCPLCGWCHPMVNDAIRSDHSLVPPSPPVLNLAQHQSLFQWVGCSHPVIQVLKLQLQHQSFQWIFRVDSFRTDWFDLLAVEGTLKGETDHQPRLDAWDKRLDLVHWEDPEGSGGEGGVRGDRDGEHM